MQAIEDLGINASYRQIDYWCALGLLGEKARRRGPGWIRQYDVRDFEVIDTLSKVRKLTRSIPLARIADLIRCRPVDPAGEVLVIEADGTAYRFDHWCGVAGELAIPVCVIPLRSFASVTATDGDSSPAIPRPAGEPGAAVSSAAAAPSSSP